MPGARVQSSDSLSDVRGALLQFAERSQAALASLRQEARHVVRWLQEEQPQYWQHELRRAFDRVASTRIAYETCRMRTIAGHRSACIEEKVDHQKALRRLEYVQQQVDVTRKWGLRAADQTDEFFSKLGPLERTIDYEVPKMVAQLEQLLLALEAYSSPSGETISESPSPAPLSEPTTDVPDSPNETESASAEENSV